jgi:hypothetical protein
LHGRWVRRPGGAIRSHMRAQRRGVLANIATNPARSESRRAVWRALCNSVWSVFAVKTGAALGENKIEELASRATIALTERVSEVDVVVQMGDGTRIIGVGNHREIVEAVVRAGVVA